MNGKNKDDRFASPESVAIRLNPIALIKAKIVYNFGQYEYNKVKVCFDKSLELLYLSGLSLLSQLVDAFN